jgi:uncharacterized protein (DUF2147 family)
MRENIEGRVVGNTFKTQIDKSLRTFVKSALRQGTPSSVLRLIGVLGVLLAAVAFYLPWAQAQIQIQAQAQAQAQAQTSTGDSLLGIWVTHDDDTQEPRAHIKITLENGVLSGRIIKTLDPNASPDERCTLCKDDRKNQPILGLEIIRGGSKKDNKSLIWEGGRILDPENGEEYRFRMRLIDQGRTLQVRGYLGPFWRTQVWTRL